MTSPSCATTSIGARSSTPGSWRANSPAILDDPQVGEAARNLLRDAQRCWTSIIDNGWLRRAPSSASSRPPALGDDVPGLPATDPVRTPNTDCPLPAPADGAPARPAQPLPGRLYRPLGSGVPTTWASLPSLPALVCPSWWRIRAQDHDDYVRHPGESAGRPAGGSVGRAPAPAGAPRSSGATRRTKRWTTRR
jgi:hypothetical protein